MKDGIIGNREKIIIEIREESRIYKNIELMEQRIREDRFVAEDRIEKRIDNLSKEIKDNKKEMENKFSNLSKEVRDDKKDARNISITTIIGVASIVATVISVVINVLKK